ncbi:hypothetical protein [Candidatus Lokiarchaeum ossiferum]|uniref:hypothetical protein n=1 Tax=Candidatus Lokiarchaeum ossiferum TaxID=2951803 RepID=UPI00352C8C02
MPRGSRGGGSRGGGGHSRRRSSYHRYRRRGYYHHRRSSSICNCCFFIVFFGMFATIGGFILISPRTNITEITLSPFETYMVESKLTANYVDVIANSGIRTYFFNEEPAKSENIEYSEQDSFNIPGGYYEYVSYFMKTGTTFTLNFSSSSGERIDFYLLKGENQYNNFIDSENSFSSEEDFYVAAYTDFQYTCSKSDRYYLVWENYDDATVVNYSIDINFTEYDVSAALNTYTGAYRLESVTYPIMIFKNMLNDTDLYLKVEVELPPIIQNPIPVFGGVLAIIVICGVCIAKSLKKSKNSITPASKISEGSFDPSLYGNTGSTPKSGSHDTKEIKLSSTCGSCSAILDEDSQKSLLMDGFVFCKYCGSKITR